MHLQHAEARINFVNISEVYPTILLIFYFKFIGKQLLEDGCSEISCPHATKVLNKKEAIKASCLRVILEQS